MSRKQTRRLLRGRRSIVSTQPRSGRTARRSAEARASWSWLRRCFFGDTPCFTSSHYAKCCPQTPCVSPRHAVTFLSHSARNGRNGRGMHIGEKSDINAPVASSRLNVGFHRRDLPRILQGWSTSIVHRQSKLVLQWSSGVGVVES
jgi:hypothetical protein